MSREPEQVDFFEWMANQKMDDIFDSAEFQKKIKAQELYFERGQTLLSKNHPDSFYQMLLRRIKKKPIPKSQKG